MRSAATVTIIDRSKAGVINSKRQGGDRERGGLVRVVVIGAVGRDCDHHRTLQGCRDNNRQEGDKEVKEGGREGGRVDYRMSSHDERVCVSPISMARMCCK